MPVERTLYAAEFTRVDEKETVSYNVIVNKDEPEQVAKAKAESLFASHFPSRQLCTLAELQNPTERKKLTLEHFFMNRCAVTAPVFD